MEVGIKITSRSQEEVGESCQDTEYHPDTCSPCFLSMGSIQRLNRTVGPGSLVLCGICSSSTFLWESLFYLHLDHLFDSFIILFLVVSFVFVCLFV